MKQHLFVLPCCADVPAFFEAKARYALEMLLGPLGIVPRWVQRSELTTRGLYYGMEPDGLPGGVVGIPFHASTLGYFASGRMYEPADARWRQWGGWPWPVLFPLVGVDGESDDLIASTFFWLAGWQEHTNPVRDRHGRFAYADSLQRRFAIVDRPVVDAYRLMLADTLRSYGIPVGQRTWAGKEWAVCPTHDVDYLRKWRPGIVYRELVEYGVLNRRRVPLRERAQRVKASVQSWLGPRDPYTMSLRRMIEAEHRRGITATYFVKTGAHRPYDPAYALHHGEGRQRLWDLQAKGFEIGLHPTYFAASHAGYMGAEARMLKDITERSARSVRQHYLCFDPDVTPRLHEQTGFSFDSTLGFADQEGFRHGTCHPFRLYDIRENRPYGLVEFPLIIMEATLFNRRHLDTGEALTVTRNLMDTCRRFRGVCTILWHEIIYDPIDCPGWADHFEGTLDLALEEDAYIASIHDIWDSQGMAGV